MLLIRKSQQNTAETWPRATLVEEKNELREMRKLDYNNFGVNYDQGASKDQKRSLNMQV